MNLIARRLPAWVCIILLAVLSWLPGDEMVRTDLGPYIEHFVAYFGTMIVIALAYGDGPGIGRRTALLIFYAGILEIGQDFSPGRHPSFTDFGLGALGALAGCIVGLFLWRFRRSTRRSRI